MRRRLTLALITLLLVFTALFFIGLQGYRLDWAPFNIGIPTLLENGIIMALSIVGITMSLREIIRT
ncbi:MAG: hypothetical protein ACQESG_06095 [Nanobdellota archaeon]